MKIFARLLASLTLLFAFSVFTFAQNAADKWVRVQSDNGEFSIEIPKTSHYFYDKTGFWTAHDRKNYRLENMSLLNSFYEQTLISFEVYQAKKGALDAFIEDDRRNADFSETARDGVIYKQIVKKTDDYYFARRYFNSKNFIYILTVGSKSGETPAGKRFFDSIVFKPDTKEPPNPEITAFSGLKRSAVKIETANEKDFPAPPKNPAENADVGAENKDKLLVFHRPRPSYVDSARRYHVEGTIKLRVTFSADGFFPQVLILKSLPENLLIQAFFAALRMKFIPKHENSKPVDSSKTVEYRFDIY